MEKSKTYELGRVVNEEIKQFSGIIIYFRCIARNQWNDDYLGWDYNHERNGKAK